MAKPRGSLGYDKVRWRSDYGVRSSWVCIRGGPPATPVTATRSLTVLAQPVKCGKGLTSKKGDAPCVLGMAGMEKTLRKQWARCLPSWWPDSMKLDLVSFWPMACDFL